MAQTKIPARDMVFEVRAADNTTYLSVGGVNNFVLNPGENEETEDTTTFDSDGNYEEVVLQRGASIQIQGFFHEDDSTGVQDAGQSRIEDLAALKGSASLGTIRFRHPLASTWKVWTATFRLGDQGGGNNNNITWSATVRRSGAATSAAVV